ncbi:MAG: hypothetical protein WC824_09230, partial [Bacteroidota bacterium]
MKHHIHHFLLTFVILSVPVFGQQWISRYNSSGIALDEAASMTTKNSRVYISGSSFSPAGGWDIVTLCLDRAGNTLWEDRQATPMDEKAVSVVSDGAGNTYVLGRVWGSNNLWQLLLLAYDNEGNVQLTKTFNTGALSSDMPIGLGLMTNGNLAVAAEAHALDGSVSSIVMVVSSDGTVVWTDSYSGAGDAYPRSLSAGSVIAVTGTTRGGATADGFIVMYQNDGTRIAARTYDGGLNADETFSSSVLDSQGRLHAAGWAAMSPTSSQVLLAEYESDGSFVSDYTYTPGTDGRHRAAAVGVDGSDNVLLTARIDAGGGDFNMMTTRRGS